MIEVKDRLIWPDLLKCFAVLLVIIGHVSSQYDSRGYSSPLCIWIYSFHMPLFMMLSGMFFKHALKKDSKSLLCTKIRQLIIPLLSWSLIILLVEILFFTRAAGWGTATKEWISAGGPLRGYWYLKCLFLYLTVNYIIVKVFKNLQIASIASIILFIALPNINFTRMMIVFFWMGVFYEQISEKLNHKTLLIVSLIIMILCYCLLDNSATYLGAKTPSKYIQYLLSGASSSLFWVSLFRLMIPSRTDSRWILSLQKIGTLSLGIYCIHELFYFKRLYGPIFGVLPSDNSIIYIAYSLLVFTLSYAFIRIIDSYRPAAYFLLGKKQSNKKTT